MTEDSDQTGKENKENPKSNVTSNKVKISSSNKTTTFSTSTLKKDKSREAPQNRVVIRHLPPTMTSEEFLEAISPVPEHNDYYFCRSDMSLGTFGFCRAYINFIHMEDVFVFKEKFDDYVFVDAKGNEFAAIVEFAPYQRVLRRRLGPNGQPISAKKRDNKCGTIEQDSDYTLFLEELEKIKTEANMPSADVYLEEIEARDKQLKANHGCMKVTTPLIEFIKTKKLEKNRLREERREERKRQQLEQKRIREEEQQKKLKLLKSSDDNKPFKDEKRGEGRERTGKSEDERSKQKSGKESDRRSKTMTKSSDSKRTDQKESEKSEKKSNQYRSDKNRDSNVRDRDRDRDRKRERDRDRDRERDRERMRDRDRDKNRDKDKESKDKESTFVVKVVQNTDEEKKAESYTENSDKKSEINREVSNDQNKKIDEQKSDKSETSKHRNDSSIRRDSEGRRIRNKDRPTQEIYRPGAVKRTGRDQSPQNHSTSHKSSSNNKSEQTTTTTTTGYKQRVFTRSKQ